MIKAIANEASIAAPMSGYLKCSDQSTHASCDPHCNRPACEVSMYLRSRNMLVGGDLSGTAHFVPSQSAVPESEGKRERRQDSSATSEPLQYTLHDLSTLPSPPTPTHAAIMFASTRQATTMALRGTFATARLRAPAAHTEQ